MIAFLDCTSNVPVPELPIEEPSVALGQGYSEAKWVSEQILYRAAKATPLRPIVVRVGQISGGINGSWNPSDWVPAIVKSSLRIGFLPELKGVSSYILSFKLCLTHAASHVHGFLLI